MLIEETKFKTVLRESVKQDYIKLQKINEDHVFTNEFNIKMKELIYGKKGEV